MDIIPPLKARHPRFLSFKLEKPHVQDYLSVLRYFTEHYPDWATYFIIGLYQKKDHQEQPAVMWLEGYVLLQEPIYCSFFMNAYPQLLIEDTSMDKYSPSAFRWNHLAVDERGGEIGLFLDAIERAKLSSEYPQTDAEDSLEIIE